MRFSVSFVSCRQCSLILISISVPLYRIISKQFMYVYYIVTLVFSLSSLRGNLNSTYCPVTDLNYLRNAAKYCSFHRCRTMEVRGSSTPSASFMVFVVMWHTGVTRSRPAALLGGPSPHHRCFMLQHSLIITLSHLLLSQ